jgi:hypothetical protein
VAAGALAMTALSLAGMNIDVPIPDIPDCHKHDIKWDIYEEREINQRDNNQNIQPDVAIMRPLYLSESYPMNGESKLPVTYPCISRIEASR